MVVVVVVVVVCGDGGSCDGSGTKPLFSGWIGIKQMIHASSSGDGGRGGDTDGGIRDGCVFDGGMYRVNDCNRVCPTTGTVEDTEEVNNDEEDIGKSVTHRHTQHNQEDNPKQHKRKRVETSTTIANNAFF